MTISVIIPVYKNRTLFIENLKNNFQFISDNEIVVIDDASHESIAPSIKKISSRIIVIENKKNLGFAKSVNIAASQARGELFMMLNSDVKLIDDSYKRLISDFNQNKNLFGVSFLQIEKNNNFVGKNSIEFKRGLIQHKTASDKSVGMTGWLEGGSMILRKSFFYVLGGFDGVYAPFYWEDIDLSFRALKHGWQLIFDPSIKVYHNHQSTIGKYFSRAQIKRISFRNSFIFIWKNIHDRKMLFQHIILLPYNIIYYFLKGERDFLWGFVDGLRLITQIIRKRRNEKKYCIKKDSEVLLMTK